MSLVDCHEMGMLSSVMRALKHMEARALRGQRPSVAAAGSAIGVAVGPAASAGRCRTGTKPEHAPIGGLRVTTPIGTHHRSSRIPSRRGSTICLREGTARD